MIVFDNFLNDEEWEVFSDVSNWQQRRKNLWIEYKQEPTDLWQALALKIWDWYDPKLECVGYEYWTNILSPSLGLGWHTDKDEIAWAQNNILLTPRIGCVLYGHATPPLGGYLEVWQKDGMERIQSVPNRLIIFEAGKRHRVSNINDGLRYTFASNVWDTRIKLAYM